MVRRNMNSLTALVVATLILAGCGGTGGGGANPLIDLSGGDCRGVSQPADSGPGTYDGEDGYTTVQKGPLRLGGAECNGSIADITAADNWLFEGKTDQTITISVKAQGEADPNLTVIDPAGEVFDADDDGGGGTSPLLTTTLPSDGIYTLRIDAFTEGAYTISVKEGTLPEDEELPEEETLPEEGTPPQ